MHARATDVLRCSVGHEADPEGLGRWTTQTPTPLVPLTRPTPEGFEGGSGEAGERIGAGGANLEGVLSAWSIEGADLGSLACLSPSTLGPHGPMDPLDPYPVEECCEREALCKHGV